MDANAVGLTETGAEYAGATDITGTLAVSGFSAADVLSNLGCLEKVENLQLSMPEVSQVSSLSRLREVTGSLNIELGDALSAQSISDWSGFASLETVGGNLVVAGSHPDAGFRFEQFKSLETVGGTLKFELDAPVVSGPPSLTSVGNLVVGGYSGSGLGTLAGFAGLQSISGNLAFRGGVIQNHAHSLPNLTEIGGNLVFTQWAPYGDLNVLNTVTSVGGQIEIRDCMFLERLDGLDNLTTSGGIAITGNEALLSVDAFAALQGTGPVVVRDNYSLTSFAGFPSLTSASDLVVDEAPALVEFGGSPNLATVAGSLSFTATSLDELPAFPALSTVGNLDVSNNPQLTSVADLGMLAEVGYDLLVSLNPNLISFQGWSSQFNVGHRVIIENNDSLSSVSTLSSITVSNSPDPNAIVSISSNPSLPACDAEALGDSIMAAGYTGQLKVQNNLGECEP